MTLLLDYGADKSIVNDAGQTPLDVGVSNAALSLGTAAVNGVDGEMEVGFLEILHLQRNSRLGDIR